MRFRIPTIVYGVAIFALLFAACKTKKKVTLPGSSLPTEVSTANAASIKSFELNNLDYHTFSGRAKTKVELGKKVHDVNLHVRIERDKAIWISVTALLGLEVARIMITPQQIQILNKLQGEYLAEPFDYIYNYTNRGVTFNVLQDVLMGNVSSSLLRGENVQVASAEDEFIVVGLQESLSYQYRVNMENRPFSFLLQEVGGSNNLETYYGEYGKVTGYNFPHAIAFSLYGGEMSLKMQLNYNRVVFNEAVEMPFTVSDRYKVIK